MVKLLLQELIQEGSYHYGGAIKFSDIAVAFRDYPFDEEVTEKARIQKAQMEACGFIPDFTLTIRVDPHFKTSPDGDSVLLEAAEVELTDGKSKAAAIVLLSPEFIGECSAFVQIFAVTREKMDSLTSNRP